MFVAIIVVEMLLPGKIKKWASLLLVFFMRVCWGREGSVVYKT